MQQFMSDGLTGEARDELEQQEIAAIKGVKWQKPTVTEEIRERPKTIFVHSEENDDEESTSEAEEPVEDEDDEEDGIERPVPRQVPLETLTNGEEPAAEDDDSTDDDEEYESEEETKPIERVAGNLEDSREPVTTDEDGESEDVLEDTSPDTGVEDTPSEDEVAMVLANAPMTKFQNLKETNYQVFKIFMEKVMEVAGRDLILDILGMTDMTPSDDAESVEIDQSNTDIPRTDREYDPDEPRIDYRVVNDEESSELNGILVNVHGDFDTAYEKCGLPIYVSLDNGREYTMAFSASALKTVLDTAITDIMEDQQARTERNMPDPDDDEPEEKDEVQDESDDIREHVRHLVQILTDEGYDISTKENAINSMMERFGDEDDDDIEDYVEVMKELGLLG